MTTETETVSSDEVLQEEVIKVGDIYQRAEYFANSFKDMHSSFSSDQSRLFKSVQMAVNPKKVLLSTSTYEEYSKSNSNAKFSIVDKSDIALVNVVDFSQKDFNWELRFIFEPSQFFHRRILEPLAFIDNGNIQFMISSEGITKREVSDIHKRAALSGFDFESNRLQLSKEDLIGIDDFLKRISKKFANLQNPKKVTNAVLRQHRHL